MGRSVEMFLFESWLVLLFRYVLLISRRELTSVEITR